MAMLCSCETGFSIIADELDPPEQCPRMWPTTMRLLVKTHGNLEEWREGFTAIPSRPRLPLPYAFGAACAQAGIAIRAIDAVGAPTSGEGTFPFEAVYDAGDLDRALAETDLVALWGMEGAVRCLRQAVRAPLDRQVAYLSYGWKAPADATFQRRLNLLTSRFAARFARCLILMTHEQLKQARQVLPADFPIVRLSVGIDVNYYRADTPEGSIPESYRDKIKSLLREPYVILPGDELRLNDDALDVVKRTGVRLVRISQYSHKSGTNKLKERVAAEGLQDRITVFEHISYESLRTLLQNAAAYAGFVDASWQPAGWTAGCEALASGTPLVMYDGLTARELIAKAIPTNLLTVIDPGDTAAFGSALERAVEAGKSREISSVARDFALRELNMDRTGPAFARDLLAALAKPA